MSIERVRKSIPSKTGRKLWVKSGGRCAYCNIDLLEDTLTKKGINKAYISHIIAASENGPRGDKVLSKKLEIAYENLMLLCDECHNRIDESDVENNSVEFLVEMKKEHEERIHSLCAIKKEQQSCIIIYLANIGEHSPYIDFNLARNIIIPEHYPALSDALYLGLKNSPQRDKNRFFWQTELNNLETQFYEQIRPKIRRGKIPHFSLFAFAPQPLLVKLGTLINDIHNIEVHQPIRIPKGWKLSNQLYEKSFITKHPQSVNLNIALNISLSATINDDRIYSVLGKNTSIYTITIKEPFNDFLKHKTQLSEFSIKFRKLLNVIKSKYSAKTPLHIFPAMPIALAIELGRIWMPKADMPLHLYDENNGFRKVLIIKNK